MTQTALFSRPAFTPLEKATFVHLAVLLIASSWIFGGNIWWMRTALAVWASLGAMITVAALNLEKDRRQVWRRIGWLTPWAGFIILVMVSAFNPSARTLSAEGDPVLVHFGAARSGWPSSVQPGKSVAELWFYASVYLAAFNVVLVARSRSWVRWLLLLGVANCLVLAAGGTVQKLVATDLYFGLAHSPNPRFFASFIYYNHWGAFMILWLTASAGLLFHYANRPRGRDLWHSPFSGAVLAVLLLATTAPVSGSRAATAMTLAVAGTVIVHGLARIIRSRRRERIPIAPPVAALLMIVLVIGAAIGWLSSLSINERYVETRRALEKNQSLLGARAELYRDSWELFLRKPAFGWGFESYASVIGLVRPRGVGLYDKHENSFAEAHNDWLQSLVETGIVGTTLAVLMVAVPLLAARRGALCSPLTRYALGGCGLVALYATIEFPFANGAVLVSFWILFFAVCQLGRLEARVAARSSVHHAHT